ncbi:hypothetical protein BJX68DRAFT_222575 [Aspergillus pseudodeflectus]|uniref:NADH dehydrogenase [ubiquinone] 1 alpha subcomplex subunit n=1 Tax=Aspergillus pseudodeflectus TaxID=176178 RepID=A0ABR4LA91_9EURO
MSPINSLWFKWKSLRLPWRRSFLVGHDLSGNTFWEFKDTLNSGRFRRIVKPRPRTHYSDLELSPQWHQWLRYVRPEPPSIKEQQDDIQRRERILLLAEMQRKKWETEQSQLDAPGAQQPGPATRTSDPTLNAGAEAGRHAPGADTSRTKAPGSAGASIAKEDPFFRPKDVPGKKWQPESWTPTPSKR